jgi:hypothetical protein
MPLQDREAWARKLNLVNFVTAYYEFRDLQLCENCRKVLIVGPGQGLDTKVLEWRGYEVTTLYIDEIFHPDCMGSIHNMDMFGDAQFDAVLASHVLEHLAEPHLDAALQEIARIGRYALIYLPVHGRHIQLRFIPGFKGLDLGFIFDLFNYFEKPDGVTPRYMANQHFWEVGMRGFRKRDIIKRMSKFFSVLSVYRNRDWLPSQNFVLKSKTAD